MTSLKKESAQPYFSSYLTHPLGKTVLSEEFCQYFFPLLDHMTIYELSIISNNYSPSDKPVQSEYLISTIARVQFFY